MMKFTALFFLVAALEIDFIDACRPDYTYIASTRASYKYHNTWVNWDVAKDTCKSEGGLLFHPDDENELRQVLSTLTVPDWVHTGLTDRDRLREYKTLDGRPYCQVFTKWHKGHPELAATHGWRCGVIDVNNYDLYIYSCDDKIPFICKIPAVDPLMTAIEVTRKSIENFSDKQTSTLERMAEAATNQSAALDRLTAAIGLQAAAMQQLTTAIGLQATNETAASDRLMTNIAAAMQQLQANLTGAMERQAQALEKLVKSVEEDEITVRSEQ